MLHKTVMDISKPDLRIVPIPVIITDALKKTSESELERLLDDSALSTADINIGLAELFGMQFRERILKGNEVILCKAAWELNDVHLRVLFKFISLGLGDLNRSKGSFFDLNNKGVDPVKPDILLPKTNSKISFYTDIDSGGYCPKIVGLLCLSQSIQGEEWQMGNTEQLWEDLKKNYPHYSEFLQEPITQGVFVRKASETKLIFEEKETEIKFSYRRHWIRSTHNRLDRLMPRKIEEAMNYIDDYFSNPKHFIEFKLNRGDMLFINNHKTAQSRRAFKNDQALIVKAWTD